MARRTTKKATKKAASRGTTSRKRNSRKKANSRVISVDFEGVETSGGSDVPEGEYLAKIVEAEQYEAQSSGEPAIKWVLEIVNGKQKGKKLYHNTSLQQKALWNLRGMLEACGFETPDSAYDVDLDEMVDVEVGVGVVIRESKDYGDQSRIQDFFPADELGENGGDDDDDDEEEENDEDEEEETEEEGDEEELTPEDVKAMKGADLEELVEANELDVDLSEHKTLKNKRAAVIEAMTDEGYFE